jgi:hypothetical protein
MGFFKKVAGAFVEIEETGPELEAVSADDLNAEAAALLAEIEAGSRAEAESEAPPPPPPVEGGGSMQIGLPFDEIYARVGVPRSPYTAEMLLRVVEGLRALPAAQAIAAVEAMDAADDRWSVVDVVADADRKVAALAAIGSEVKGAIRSAEELYSATTNALDQQLTATEDEISKQIAELEGLRKEARETVARERAGALSEMEATRQACAAESDRLDAEIKSLRQVHEFLGSSPTPETSQA